MEDLTSKAKKAKVELGTIRDEMIEMKEALPKMESESREKEKVESALKAELDEAKVDRDEPQRRLQEGSTPSQSVASFDVAQLDVN